MDNPKPSQHSSDREPFKLDPEAREALGTVSPELAWLQVKTQVQAAIQGYYDQAEGLRVQAELPVDFTDLTELLELISPVRGVNQLLYASPDLPFHNLMKEGPLRVLKAVLRMLTVSDRYLGLEP